MGTGFGQLSWGRFEFGAAKSDIEPRYDESVPVDASTGWKVFESVIRFEVYGFSSRVQDDNVFQIEISEDGGGAWVDAYASKAFVAPYNGSGSRIDFHQIDPQKCTVYLERTSLWPEETEIYVRVTAQDGYGNVSTKETPVKWQ